MRAESAWGHSCVKCVCVWRAPNAKATQGQGASEGRHEETERRTGGRWACSWWRFNAIVEVDERVEFLERERLRRLVVNEYTLPFLRRLLVTLEYYHFIVLYKIRNSRISGVGEGGKGKCESESGGGETETNVDCGSLNPNRGYFLARVHLDCAWLGRIYRCRLVIICEGGDVSILIMQRAAGERCGAHIARHKSLALGEPCSSAWVAGPCGP
jgi:hypothetical protein